MSFCPKIIIHGGGAAQVHMGGVATVEVGTVTTGAPGTEAQVTNSGTRTRAVLNFVIPRGADGKNADVVTVTEHENDEGEKYYTADKSYSQLMQARADGLVMKLRCVDFWQLNKELYEFDLRHVEGTDADDFVLEFGGTTVTGLLVYVTIANHPTTDGETAGYILVSTKNLDAGVSKEYVDSKDAEVVTVTQSVGSDGTASYTADKTFTQLMAAHTANRPLQLVFVAPAIYNAPLTMALTDTDDEFVLGFSVSVPSGNVAKTVHVAVTNTGTGETWTCSVVKASDISLGLSGVGEMSVPIVASVDSNGVPTEWASRTVSNSNAGGGSDLLSRYGINQMLELAAINMASLGMVSAKVRQVPMVGAVNEEGVPTAWYPMSVFNLLNGNISTAISSTSTDNELATAKAVYDAITTAIGSIDTLVGTGEVTT